MKEILAAVESHMKRALDQLGVEFKNLRVGRASPALLDGVMVEYYGASIQLNQLGTVAAPEVNLIVVQPYDPTQIAAIERAIVKSGAGLSPSNDGKAIRIPVPALTDERRRELVKHAHDLAEQARNAVRQARRDGNERVKKLTRDKAITLDDERRGLDDVQNLHDRYIAEINFTSQKKEQQLLEAA